MTRAVVATWLAGMLGMASTPAAQTPGGPAFEVASVKPSQPDAGGARGTRAGMKIEAVGGRFTASNVPLQHLVLVAYDLHENQIVGGPDWKISRTFDIRARVTDSVAGLDAMLPMLKGLLAERFQLKVHTERRDMPISALLVARDDGTLGPNISRSTADCSRAERELAEARAKNGPSALTELLQAGKGLPCTIMPVPARAPRSTTLRSNGQSMASLASLLTAATGRVVQDRTGLSGLYDWEMTYDRAVTPRAEQPAGSNTSPAATAPSESPSLMTALQEQLGLQLKAARGTVEVLVIDSAALPEPD
jgi:uncharacterized protein (TIGR03435 family)